MEQDFRIGELQAWLEDELGFGLSSLSRLTCVNSLNFKAVRGPDGYAFLVKCLPARRLGDYLCLTAHLREMKGTKAVQQVFGDRCAGEFRGNRIVCLEWCDGRSLFPDELTRDELVRFLEDYLALSEALQRTTLPLPGYTPKEWRDGALAACRGVWGGWLRRMVDETPEEECCYREERLRIVHGDLHPGNFAFRDGRVAAYFDLASFARGYPALDMVRYFGFAAEHLPWFRFGRRKRLFRWFGEAVRRLPYPADEWIVAINATWMERIDKKLAGGPARPLALLHLAFAGRLYRKLRGIVREASGKGEVGHV